MTTYNTGNPLGSADPRDLYDNAENLDEAVNDLNSDTWVDRFGVERLTIQGALNRFNDVIIAGGQIFESEEAGRAAVQDGQYYYTVSDDPNVSRELWQRIDANNSELIAEDPSAEGLRNSVLIANAAIDLASQPNAVTEDFHTADGDNSLFTIKTAEGDVLAEWDQYGRQTTVADSEFSRGDDELFFSIKGDNDKPLMGVDKHLQIVTPMREDFFTEDDQPVYCWVDIDGWIFFALDANLRVVVGGGSGLDTNLLPDSDFGLADKSAWINQLSIDVVREHTPEFDISIYDRFDTHLDLYEFCDSLVNDHSDYVSDVGVIGLDEAGNDIKAYRFKPDLYRETGNFYPSDGIALPKILLIGLTHGNEQQAAVGNLLFIDDLCRRWETLPGLESLRWGCEIVFIPCLNPWGYDNRSRRNFNNVDLNRNFPTGWDNAPSGSRGPSPASESETQTLIAFVDSESSSVPITSLVDHHRMFGFPTSEMIAWIGCRGDENLWVASKAAQDSVRFTRKALPYTGALGVNSRITSTSNGTVSRHFQETGLNSFLLESPSITGTGVQRESLFVNRNNLLSLLSRILEREDNKRIQFFENPLGL